MICPVDQTPLAMSDRQGIEIDYCPTCRGVWLDRGELDKIIDRNAGAPAPQASPHAAPASHEARAPEHYRDDHRPEHYRDDHRGYNDHRGYDHHHKKHKKEGFLGDLFDF